MKLLLHTLSIFIFFLFLSNEKSSAQTNDFSCMSVKGTDTTGQYPRAVAISGNYAYIIDQGANDFRVYDISDPTSPTQVGVISTGSGSTPLSLAVQGNYAYVLNYSTAH